MVRLPSSRRAAQRSAQGQPLERAVPLAAHAAEVLEDARKDLIRLFTQREGRMVPLRELLRELTGPRLPSCSRRDQPLGSGILTTARRTTIGRERAGVG